jgi:16S rRNA G1207 methylase RsmC
MTKSTKTPEGNSQAPRDLILNTPLDNSSNISVLDIGFGAGVLGHFLKNKPEALH